MKMDRRKFLGTSSALLSAGALGAAGGVMADAAGARAAEIAPHKYRLVATEEAFATPEQVETFRHMAATEWNDPNVVI